ncbi:ribonuclease H-like domain-containing protein [Tanacetum coccineum]
MDLVNFDWSNKDDDTPVSLALMATNHEKKNKRNKIQALKERDDFKVKLEKLSNASYFQNEVPKQAKNMCLISHVYGLIESSNSMESEHFILGMKSLTDSAVRKFQQRKGLQSRHLHLAVNKVIIEDWVDSDDEETDVSESQKETAFNSENSETSFENRSPNNQNSVGQESRTKGTGTTGAIRRRSQGHASYDSGCSGSMTGDKDKLSDFKEFKGGYVAFGNDSKGGRISGKGTIKTSCLDFEKVSYVEELKFNLLSVSQICDKKHNVLFTDKECLILSPKFKFVDEDLVILRAPRKNDVYSLDLKNIIPSGGITCLVAKATEDEAVLWHRRLGHVNFKNITIC